MSKLFSCSHKKYNSSRLSFVLPVILSMWQFAKLVARHFLWVLWFPASFIGHWFSQSSSSYRLVGLVVKASASRAEGLGFESRLRRDFFGVESYQ